MATSNVTVSQSPKKRNCLVLLAGLLGLCLAILFYRSFDPDEVVFSNDGPLGGLKAELNRMPSVLFGAWHDINWIGSQSPTPALNVTSALRLLCGPVLFAKIFAPFAMFFLGIAAGVFFRQ